MGSAHTQVPAFFAEKMESSSAPAVDASVSGLVAEPGKAVPTEPSTADLWTLYKHAIDDRNFQVTLNWDRTKHYFVFNAAVLAAAGGLTHLTGAFGPAAGACLLLVTLNAFFGAFSIWKGHGYYRESRKRMKAIEKRLIGNQFAAMTTRGMKRDTFGEAITPFRERLTITNAAITLQIYIAVASGYALFRLLTRH